MVRGRPLRLEPGLGLALGQSAFDAVDQHGGAGRGGAQPDDGAVALQFDRHFEVPSAGDGEGGGGRQVAGAGHLRQVVARQHRRGLRRHEGFGLGLLLGGGVFGRGGAGGFAGRLLLRAFIHGRVFRRVLPGGRRLRRRRGVLERQVAHANLRIQRRDDKGNPADEFVLPALQPIRQLPAGGLGVQFEHRVEADDPVERLVGAFPVVQRPAGGRQVEPGGAQGLEEPWIAGGQVPSASGVGGQRFESVDHFLQQRNGAFRVAAGVDVAGLAQSGRRPGRQPCRALDLEVAPADLLDADPLRGSRTAEAG